MQSINIPLLFYLDLSGVKPTFEVYLTDLKHDQGGFVKEIPRDRIDLLSWRLQDYVYMYI